MTIEEIKQLHTGDEVYWNDPDEGRCSRVYKILTIEYNEEERVVTIMEDDGSVLSCFPEELS